jgi:predicted restriction endonuclease
MVMCYKCQRDKDPTEFYKSCAKARSMAYRKGCHSYCKLCYKQFIIDAKRTKRIEYRKKIFEHYGNKCAVCGFDDIRALALDHVNNNGAEERRMWRGKMDFFYKKIINDGYPSSYQILCSNCNAIKEYDVRD